MEKIIEYIAQIVGSISVPEDPDKRRRWYVHLAYLSAVIALIGFLLSSNLETLSLISGTPRSYMGPVIGWGYALLIIGAAASGFCLLQIFLEFGGGATQSGAQPAPASSNAMGPVDQDDELSSALVDELEEVVPRPARPKTPRFVLIATSMRNRIKQEIRAQGRKANTNLGMGVLTAFLGMGFLGWLAFDTSNASNRLAEAIAARAGGEADAPAALSTPHPMLYWGQFGAKVALSVSANIFSLFFLSTYRRNLTEIKYFQNELTNVESHLVALYFAMERKFTDTEKKLLIRLSEVERNFILRRGETTADIQIKDMDTKEISALVGLAAQLARGSSSAPELPKRAARLRKGAA